MPSKGTEGRGALQRHLTPELHKLQTKGRHNIDLLLQQLEGTISFLPFTHGVKKKHKEMAGVGSHMDAARSPAGCGRCSVPAKAVTHPQAGVGSGGLQVLVSILPSHMQLKYNLLPAHIPVFQKKAPSPRPADASHKRSMHSDTSET